MVSLRQEEILDVLQIRGRCTIGELSREFGVSDETIRRDIRKLASEGVVEPLRGGVALPEVVRETAFHYCLFDQVEAKRTIARRAAAEVANGARLFIAGGSTTVYFAHALRHHLGLTVVTNSLDIARLLVTRNGNRVFPVGGEMRAADGTVLGPLAIDFIRRFSAEMAFFTGTDLDPAEGLMHDELADVELTQAIVEGARRAFALVDGSKFGGRGLIRMLPLAGIDTLITEAVPDARFRAPLAEAGVRLLVGEPPPEACPRP